MLTQAHAIALMGRMHEAHACLLLPRLQALRLCKAAALHLVSLHMRKEAAELRTQALELHCAGGVSTGCGRSGNGAATLARAAVHAARSKPPVAESLVHSAESLEDRTIQMEAKAGRKAQVGRAHRVGCAGWVEPPQSVCLGLGVGRGS